MNAQLPSSEEAERRERFLALFLPEQASIRAFIRAMVWDGSRCEDIFQEVALVLWREMDRYDAGRPFGPWARGVAAKTVLKALREARRSSRALSVQAVEALRMAFDELAAARAASPGDQSEALQGCLQRLPDRSRTLVRLRFRDSLTVPEIAARTGSTPEAVQKALSRLRLALAKCVERRLRAV